MNRKKLQLEVLERSGFLESDLKLIGIKKFHLINCINGNKNPSILTFSKMCETFHLSTNYLFDLTENKEISFDSNHPIPFNYDLNVSLLSEEDRKTFIEYYQIIKKKNEQEISLFVEEMPDDYISCSKCEKNKFNHERLRKLILETGLNTEQFSKIGNFNINTARSWNTKNQSPKINSLKRICYMLQCSGDYLLGLSNDPNIIWNKDDLIISVKKFSRENKRSIYKTYSKLIDKGIRDYAEMHPN